MGGTAGSKNFFSSGSVGAVTNSAGVLIASVVVLTASGKVSTVRVAY